LYFTGVRHGTYKIVTTYLGNTPKYPEPIEQYPAKFMGMDTTTSGNWGKIFGKDGYVLCNYNGAGVDKRALPSYVSAVSYYKVKGNGEPLNTVWEPKTNDQRALAPDAGNGTPRTASCLYSADADQIGYTFTCTIDIKGVKNHQVSLYFVDWDKKRRKISVEMFDAATSNLIAPVKIVENSIGGTYLKFAYNKSVKFRINMVRGDNAVLNGIFFDPVSSNKPIRQERSGY